MANVYEIPLVNSPQTFSISLSNVLYNVRVLWNIFSNAWVLDFYDANEVLILASIPFVTGVDLLSPYPDLSFNGKLFAHTDYDADIPPTFDNLVITGHVYWVTE